MSQYKLLFGQYFLLFISLLFTSSLLAENTLPNTQSSNDFKVSEIRERNFQNVPALAIILSEPLSSKQSYDTHIRVSNNQGIVDGAWVLSDDGYILFFPHVEPVTRYSVSVLESLAAKSGVQLGHRVNKSIKTRKITPAVSFASQGLLLPADMTAGLPVVTVNVDEVDIEFIKIPSNKITKYLDWHRNRGEDSYYRLQRLRKFSELVYSGRFSLKPKPNTRSTVHIPVEDIDALKKPGLYVAVMKQPGEYRYNYKTAYFFVSDIGVHLRAYKNKSVIYASSLKTGQALQDVEVTLRNRKGRVLKTGLTDASGRFTYQKNISGTVLVTAQFGYQVTFLPLNTPALDLSDFPVGKRQQKPLEAFIYSPRDLYRPGEEVIISALLRDYDGSAVAALSLPSKLYRPDGRLAKSFNWRPKDKTAKQFGYYQTHINLPYDAPTGKWRLQITTNPGKTYGKHEFYFQVEEFLPERMKLSLTPKQSNIFMNDEFLVNVQGDYLYGAPASGNRLDGMVHLKSIRKLMPKFKDFEFGLIDKKTYQKSWKIDDRKLDKIGNSLVTIKNRWDKIKTPLSIKFVGSLYESGGRPVTRAVQSTIWPANTLIGIRPLFDTKNAASKHLQFELIKTTQAGDILSAKSLQMTVIKEDRDYYWEYSNSSGWRHAHTESHYPVLSQTVDLLKEKVTPIDINVTEGTFRLEILDPETQLISSIRFNTGWYWWGDSDSKRSTRPDQVKLQLDKKHYKPGDTIKLMVTPPHSGEAIITVENNKPLWFKRQIISASGSIVEIPVKSVWDSHDIYITATVFRPGDAKQKITPNRAMGIVYLPLDRTDRELNVSLQLPEKIQPFMTLNTRVKVENVKKQSMMVTLAAVDVGVLNITDFETPDVIDGFFGQRRYSVESYDIYGKVIENNSGKKAKIRFGGDADIHSGGKQVNAEVRITSLFSGLVKLDDNGEAIIPLTIPDFNGRLKLMVVAFSDDSFGVADDEVTVAAPIVAEIAMPKFLAVGDSSMISLDVHNLSGSEQTLDINLTASLPLLLEQGQRKISLKDGEKTVLRFAVKGANEFGVSQIDLSLNGRFIKFSRHWQLGVRPAYPAITERIRKTISKDESYSIDTHFIKTLMPNTIENFLTVSNVPPLNINDAVKGLLQYPYGCLEQTTSRVYPLLYSSQDEIAKFGLKKLTQEDRSQRIQKALQRISTMQLPSGGFGLWNKKSQEEAWLTPYVVDFMLEARTLGVKVPTLMLNKALKRLQKKLRRGFSRFRDNHYSDHPKHLSFAAQSYAAYVLANVGSVPLSSLRTLHDHHRQAAKSGLPLLHLGIALKKMGDHQRAKVAFDEAVKVTRSDDDYLGDYGSPSRDIALMIYLMKKHQLELAIEPMIFQLSDLLKNRQWHSTQERYALFRAGLELLKMNGTQWSATLKINDGTQHLKTSSSYKKSFDFDALMAGVSLKSSHKKSLYLSMVTSGYGKTAPKVDMQEIDITRTFYDMNGNV
ncbi:MAG: alpha-2-macroglobulin family protein, partial [Methylococcales bacterium]|nr:alpha-2-macroglobulin family protein [Methylococcales bacterium]